MKTLVMKWLKIRAWPHKEPLCEQSGYLPLKGGEGEK